MILELLLAVGVCAAATAPNRHQGGGSQSWGEWPPPLKDDEDSCKVVSSEHENDDGQP